jgi:hypothetical protein
VTELDEVKGEEAVNRLGCVKIGEGLIESDGVQAKETAYECDKVNRIKLVNEFDGANACEPGNAGD